MKTPYEILDVPEESSDSEIKKAYLAKVRQYPPERFPEMFQQIRQAYELIRTESERLSYKLFHTSLPEPVAIAEIILKKKLKQLVLSRAEFNNTLSQDLQNFCKSLTIE